MAGAILSHCYLPLPNTFHESKQFEAVKPQQLAAISVQFSMKAFYPEAHSLLAPSYSDDVLLLVQLLFRTDGRTDGGRC